MNNGSFILCLIHPHWVVVLLVFVWPIVTLLHCCSILQSRLCSNVVLSLLFLLFNRIKIVTFHLTETSKHYRGGLRCSFYRHLYGVYCFRIPKNIMNEMKRDDDDDDDDNSNSGWWWRPFLRSFRSPTVMTGIA